MASGRDWTLHKYAEILHCVRAADYPIRRIDAFISAPCASGVLLRHDVDRIPHNSLRMAELEHQHGVSATYYVRCASASFDSALVTRLHELGHEVGYHYEVLAKAGGDMAAAIDMFATELTALRRLGPVLTASAHGSPLSKWDSLDIWRAQKPQDFELLGEAYLQIDDAQMAYYTDTGRSWSATVTNLRDHVGEHGQKFPVVDTTSELIELVSSRALPLLCIQTHPERWNSTISGTTRSLLFDFAANSAKRAIRALRGHRGRR